MKVYTNIDDVNAEIKNPIVTTGTFDGVHLGHQKILERIKNIAREINGETVVLTFYPHPRMVLFPEDNELKLLNTIEEKKQLLEQYGIDHLIIYPFTKNFSRLTSVEFVRNILVNKIHVKKLVIGYNHQFGRNREGSFEQLVELGGLFDFDVEEIPAKDIDSIEISSTKIRKALSEGDIVHANEFLGHEYTINGRVVEGKKIGRTIGFPTANVFIEDKHKLIPADGVYAVKIIHSGMEYDGMLNIGNNPTLTEKGRSIEVNIFNFNKEIYNEQITVRFVNRIRNEIKFTGLEALKRQLELDKITSEKILNS